MQETSEHRRQLIEERFERVANEPDQKQKFPIGPESAKTLGYDADLIDGLPTSVTESFAGVGNPHSHGELRSGQSVLDLGSGAGLDSILAALQVGPEGRVVGVEMTNAMIEKARRNVEIQKLENVEFIHGGVDVLPFPDNRFDVALSNGVINLCPDKPKVLADVFRVLKPGGKIQMADILLHSDVSRKEVESKGSWSD